jgi:ABC-type sugar transport system permease subunit
MCGRSKCLASARAIVPFPLAAAIWEVILLGAFGYTLWRLGIRRPATWLAVGLLGMAIAWTLSIGQAEALVALLLTLGSPFSVAFAANIKLLPILVGLYWLGRRDWRNLGLLVGWTLGLILLQLVLDPADTLAFPATLTVVGTQADASSNLSLLSVALMSVWKWAGYNMLIFLAALKGISESLYEAAEIDGITPWKKLIHIKIPLIMPSIYFVVLTCVIDAFQIFTEVYIMTQGGPGYSTHTVVYYLWASAFRYSKMGYACAIAVVMFAIITIVTVVQNKVLDKHVQYDT